MAGKRKSNRTTAEREDLSKPSAWRLQHGGFGKAKRAADPETGTPIAHRRAVDLLARLEGNGTINAAMHDAGDTFHAQFRAAALDTLRAMPLVRLPAGTSDTLTERTVHPRRKVMGAVEALGGADSAAGSRVWLVVGCECSIREWALRQGWGGRSMGRAQAQGVLVAALGVLAGHYRLASSHAA